jgi:hypothetical protein
VGKAGKWIGLGVALIGLITIAFIVAAALFPEFRVISRDIAIVILAVFMMIGAILIIILLLAVLYAIKTLQSLTQKEVVPKMNIMVAKVNELLDITKTITTRVRDSADTATETTVFVAEQVASPIIRVSGVVAGVRAAASMLAHRGNGKNQTDTLDDTNSS